MVVTLLLWSAIASGGYEDWRPMMQFDNMTACVKAQALFVNRTSMCIHSITGEGRMTLRKK